MTSQTTAQGIEYWPLERLVEYHRNPRKNDAAVDRLSWPGFLQKAKSVFELFGRLKTPARHPSAFTHQKPLGRDIPSHNAPRKHRREILGRCCGLHFRSRFGDVSIGSRRSPPYKGVANWRTDLFATVRHHNRRTGKLSLFSRIEAKCVICSPVRHFGRRTHAKKRRWRTEKRPSKHAH